MVIMGIMTHSFSLSFVCLIIVSAACLGACTPMKAVRGNLIEDDRLMAIEVGKATKMDVARSLGSPTTMDPFDENTWYYLGQKTKKKGIFDPKVTEEKIIRLRFNPETGVLTELSPLDTRRNDVPIESAVTPTSGNEITAIQQMIGNIGKFNKPDGARNP